jgi:transposase
MLSYDAETQTLVGPAGSLPVLGDDEISQKLLMLIEGQCSPLGPKQAAEKFGFTKQRYYQLLKVYSLQGAAALASRKRGPKRNYRRTAEAVRQVIRHRFLDPDASAEVIAQKLTQASFTISIRSVDRIIEDFGLQKKTVPLSSKA